MTETLRILHHSGAELTAAQLHDILLLRVTVFVVEQQAAYPEIDGRDLLPDTRHLWFAGDDGVESYLRVLSEWDGWYRIGRVCTAKPGRGRGLAGRLMAAALEYIGDAPSVLDAQVHAQGFYARYGYHPVGAPFEEDGIPHITMHRP